MVDTPTRVPLTLPDNSSGGSDAASLPQPDFQPQDSYQQRLIQIAVTLAPDQKTNQPIKFSGTGSDTITLSGFRTSVRIGNYGAYGGSTAEIRIYGIDESTMNELSALGQVFNLVAKNSILVSAGNPKWGFSPVFGGTIMFAMPDYNAAPNVPFIMRCQSGYLSGVVPIPASSFPQPTDVATIMSGFANQLGLAFENNGITVKIPPSYFPGTINQQIRKLAQAANINADIVDAGARLAIWPIGGGRTSKAGQNIPLISKDTGMINYPTVSPNGYLIVNTLFNPEISFGSIVKVQSTRVPTANKTWVVQRLDLELDSLIPKGQWKAILQCYPQNLTAPTPPQAGSK